MTYRKNAAPSPTGAPSMTSGYRKYLRELQIKADFEDDTLKAQWTADQIAQAQQQNARKDFEPARFANLRNGGNLPRAAHHQPNRS